MNALGGRKAKCNIAVWRPCGVKSGNGVSEQAGDLPRPFARRQDFGECLFDVHFGYQRNVQTVQNDRHRKWSPQLLLANMRGG